MQMMRCPNCGKLSGFKRALGFGTLFMVVLTGGLWLLYIPLYPARCINCGLTRGTVVSGHLSAWFQELDETSKAFIILLSVLLFGLGIFLAIRNDLGRSRSPNDRAAILMSVPEQESAPSRRVSEDHEFHLTPNLFGKGAISDGRTYSVAVVSAYQTQVPPATRLFVQGIILSRNEPGIVTLGDEENPGKTLVCVTTPEEFQELSHLYQFGFPVQAFGTFESAAAGVPTLRDCVFSDPTNTVVRQKSLQIKAAAAPIGETASEQQTGSPDFRWPTEGLPAEIADALSSPDLAPNTSGSSIELSFSTSGQKQILIVSDDCGSAGCDWDLTDASSGRNILESGLGALHKTQMVTAGFYDLLVEGKGVLVLYQYRGESYQPTKCYSRSDGLESSAIPSPCGSD